MDKTFEFYLKDGDGRYYTVNNGIVSLVSVTPFVNAPTIGESIASWRDVEVTIERAMENWGALIQYTLDSIVFINDGATILKYIALNLGMTSKVSLVVKKLNTFTMKYDNWTECEIEMASFNYDLVSVNVTLFEGGLVGLLKNREDIEYSIPIDNNGIQAFIDGALLRSRSFWVLGNFSRVIPSAGTEDFEASSLMGYRTFYFNGYIPSTFGSSEVLAGQFIQPSSQELGVGTPDFLSVSSSEQVIWTGSIQKQPSFYTTEDWSNIRVDGRFAFQLYSRLDTGITINGVTLTGRFWANLVMVFVDTNGVNNIPSVNIGRVEIFDNSNWREYEFNYEHDIDFIPKNTKCYLIIQFEHRYDWYPPPYDTAWICEYKMKLWNDASRFNINFNAKVAPTIAIGYRYIDFLHKFVSKLTDNKYFVQSDFLSNNMNQQAIINNYGSKPRNIFITSGTGLRRLPSPNINTTWRAILHDLFSQFNIIPSYYGNIVRLEPMEVILNQQVVFDAKSVNNLEISFLTDKLFNSVKVGQTVSDNNNIVGLNEFNTTVNFLVEDNTNTKGELDLVSTFRRDVYGIESARAESIDNDRIDTKFDKDVWLIEIEETPTNGSYKPYRVNTNFISGVDDPLGIYNTTLSPKRALLRNMGYIKSFYNNGRLSFVSTDKNPSLVSNTRVPYSAIARIAETSSERLSNGSFNGVIKDALFKPIVLEFDCSSDYNLIELTSGNLNGLVRLSYNGVELKGWILNVGCKPSTRDSYRFRILSHNDNDLTLL